MTLRKQYVSLITVSFLLLFSTGCIAFLPIGKKERSEKQEEVIAVEQSNNSFQGEFREEEAMRLLYGNYDTEQSQSKWQPDRKKIDDLGFYNGDEPFYATAILNDTFSENGKERRVLITQSAPKNHDCHACAPLIGGAFFTKVGDIWQLDSQEKYIGTYGSFGQPPDFDIEQIGPNKHAIITELNFLHMGIATSSLALLVEDKGRINEVLLFSELASNNEGAGCEDYDEDENSLKTAPKCFSYESDYDFEPGQNPDFYDLKIKRTGTMQDNEGKVKPVNETFVYRFLNGKYEEVKK